jgi:hypothetical protein
MSSLGGLRDGSTSIPRMYSGEITSVQALLGAKHIERIDGSSSQESDTRTDWSIPSLPGRAQLVWLAFPVPIQVPSVRLSAASR